MNNHDYIVTVNNKELLVKKKLKVILPLNESNQPKIKLTDKN